MIQYQSDRYLLRDILKQVSRSFYLTLAVLPANVSKQIGLAYLFARAADTVADTGQIDRHARLLCLHQLKSQFLQDHLQWDAIRAIQTRMAPLQRHRGEQLLLARLEACFQLYQRLDRPDQTAIREVLLILMSGMEMDLTIFPGDTEATLTALPTFTDLDQYTYRVAGCVGEFWTNMIWAHCPRISQVWDRESKVKIGICYGKGLQLTNILRDLPQDLRRGRCYIPLSLLEEVGLQPQDLLDVRANTQFRPILRRLLGVALEHLDQGWLYTLSIPRREVRLRLACMWPILIGLRTLSILSLSENVLDPTRTHKVSRCEIYRILATTALTGGSSYAGTAYWGHFRKMVGCAELR
ncbi:MAG: squalene/phytoene synthase family protein [Nitrospirales bacterium]|nr:squalene/phytoene synthase family protein [Nitrospirales bacterium]